MTIKNRSIGFGPSALTLLSNPLLRARLAGWLKGLPLALARWLYNQRKIVWLFSSAMLGAMAVIFLFFCVFPILYSELARASQLIRGRSEPIAYAVPVNALTQRQWSSLLEAAREQFAEEAPTDWELKSQKSPLQNRRQDAVIAGQLVWGLSLDEIKALQRVAASWRAKARMDLKAKTLSDEALNIKGASAMFRLQNEGKSPSEAFKLAQGEVEAARAASVKTAPPSSLALMDLLLSRATPTLFASVDRLDLIPLALMRPAKTAPGSWAYYQAVNWGAMSLWGFLYTLLLPIFIIAACFARRFIKARAVLIQNELFSAWEARALTQSVKGASKTSAATPKKRL